MIWEEFFLSACNQKKRKTSETCSQACSGDIGGIVGRAAWGLDREGRLDDKVGAKGGVRKNGKSTANRENQEKTPQETLMIDKQKT